MPTYVKDYKPIYNRFNASRMISPEIEKEIESEIASLIIIMRRENFNPREFCQYISDCLCSDVADIILRNAFDLKKEEEEKTKAEHRLPGARNV